MIASDSKMSNKSENIKYPWVSHSSTKLKSARMGAESISGHSSN